MQDTQVLLRDKDQEKKEKKIVVKWSAVKPYGFIAPLGSILFSFYMIPILLSVYFSFTDYNIIKDAKFIGLLNYRDLLTDETFKIGMKNTFFFTLGVVPIQTILSLLMASWLVSRKKRKLTEFVKGAMFIPVISSMVLISIVWRILLNGEGSPLNMIFTALGGTPPNWLGNPSIVLLVLMGITIWKNTGYFMILYIAGLMEIPANYTEAANVDGANKLEVFWYITLPLLKPTTIMVVFLGVVWSFQTFDLIYTLTGGGPGNSSMTMVLHIYNNAFKNFNAGYAMTMANILLFITAGLAIIQSKFLKKEKSEIY
jgi:multiple sugar transport system permease protein